MDEGQMQAQPLGVQAFVLAVIAALAAAALVRLV